MPHNDPAETENDRLRERVTDLETLLTHVQHDFQQLNEVILQQQDRFTVIERQLVQLEQQLRTMADPPTEATDPLDEKPPHY